MTNEHPNRAEPLLIDVSRLLWRQWSGVRPTGIDRVCQAYLRHYALRARAVVQHRLIRRVLSTGASGKVFDALLSGDTGSLPSPASVLRIAASHGLVRAQRRPQLYLNVGHTGLDQPGLARWLRQQRLQPIYLVHDIIPITHPQLCREGEAERHAARLHTLLSTARGVIANSTATAQELLSYARKNALPLPPVCVAWLGTPQWPPAMATDATEPYFVAIGTIEARKNIGLLLDVWTELRRRGGHVPTLHLVGRRGWRCEATLERLDRDEHLRTHVVEHSDMADADLATLLTNARALLFASLVEGYGLPLYEALSLGTPAIVSDLPVFREVAGALPEYLPPLDIDAWATAVTDYLPAAAPRREAQLARLEGFVSPGWSDHFSRVDSWLEELVALPS